MCRCSDIDDDREVLLYSCLIRITKVLVIVVSSLQYHVIRI